MRTPSMAPLHYTLHSTLLYISIYSVCRACISYFAGGVVTFKMYMLAAAAVAAQVRLFPRIAVKSQSGAATIVRETETVLDEKVTLRTEEVPCPITGIPHLRTVEVVEKVIETEVGLFAMSLSLSHTLSFFCVCLSVCLSFALSLSLLPPLCTFVRRITPLCKPVAFCVFSLCVCIV